MSDLTLGSTAALTSAGAEVVTGLEALHKRWRAQTRHGGDPGELVLVKLPHQRGWRPALDAEKEEYEASSGQPIPAEQKGALLRLMCSDGPGRVLQALVMLRDVRRNGVGEKAKDVPYALLMCLMEQPPLGFIPERDVVELAQLWVALLSGVSGSRRDLSFGFLPALRSLGLEAADADTHRNRLDAQHGLALLQAALLTRESLDAGTLAVLSKGMLGPRDAAARRMLGAMRRMRATAAAAAPTLERLLTTHEGREQVATEARKLCSETAGARQRHRHALLNEPRPRQLRRLLLTPDAARSAHEADVAMGARVRAALGEEQARAMEVLQRMQRGEEVSEAELAQLANSGAVGLVEKMAPLLTKEDPVNLANALGHLAAMAARIQSPSLVVSPDHSGSMGIAAQAGDPRQAADVLAVALANMPCRPSSMSRRSQMALRRLVLHSTKAPPSSAMATVLRQQHLVRSVMDFLGDDRGHWHRMVIGFGDHAAVTRMPALEEEGGLRAQLAHVARLECGMSTNVGAMFDNVAEQCLEHAVQPPEVIWVLTDAGFNAGMASTLGTSIQEIEAQQARMRMRGLVPPLVVVHNVLEEGAHSAWCCQNDDVTLPNILYIRGANDTVIKKILDVRSLRAMQREAWVKSLQLVTGEAAGEAASEAEGEAASEAEGEAASEAAEDPAITTQILLESRLTHWSNRPLLALAETLRHDAALREAMLHLPAAREEVLALLSAEVCRGQREEDATPVPEVVAAAVTVLQQAVAAPGAAEAVGRHRERTEALARCLADMATPSSGGAGVAALRRDPAVVLRQMRLFAFAQVLLTDYARHHMDRLARDPAARVPQTAVKWLAAERAARRNRTAKRGREQEAEAEAGAGASDEEAPAVAVKRQRFKM